MVLVDVHLTFDRDDSQESFSGVLKDRRCQAMGVRSGALEGPVSLLEQEFRKRQAV